MVNPIKRERPTYDGGWVEVSVVGDEWRSDLPFKVSQIRMLTLIQLDLLPGWSSTYSPRHADPRLLAIPTSCSQVVEGLILRDGTLGGILHIGNLDHHLQESLGLF
ncbi:hypothetical protein Q3G72_015079 [Acer saccharum]|nr:hypothetical protein Q3G72_015079 [Acer saccharum]